MKKLIILTASFIFALAIMSCKKSGWETMTEDHYYVLVRPLQVNEKAFDEDQKPIKPGVWYVAEPTHVKFFSGYSPSRYLQLIDNEKADSLLKGMIEDNIAVLDTISFVEFSEGQAMTGFKGIKSMEVILLKENFSLERNYDSFYKISFRLKAD